MSAAAGAMAPFTDLEKHLIEKSEEAVRDGQQLAAWCRNALAGLKLNRLNLGKQYRLPNTAQGFFGALEIGGVKTSVMGCVQEVEFGRSEAADPAAHLRQFVLRDFIPTAHWTYPDGFPGGFTVRQSLYRDAGGSYGRFPEAEAAGCVDWRELGPKYDWVLLTVNIHDFVMEMGPLKKRMKEAACVSPHKSFVRIAENPSASELLEISVGYPFIRFAPIPNPFGFGPGKFGTAVKLYSFVLNREGGVRLRMIFAAAPRCRKVFDLGPSVPDPVYGGARLLERITLGGFSAGPFHDQVDSGMLAQHCRVHQALAEGVERVWRESSRRGAGGS